MNKIKEMILVVVMLLPLLWLASCRVDDKKDQLVLEEHSSGKEEQSTTSCNEICVYVVGEVVNPGVYMLRENARVHKAIELAGGFTENAAVDYINLAGKVSDGEKLVVYSVTQISNNEIITEEQSALVNINTADAEKLMTLPGVGESKANDIIEYREKNGSFKTIEDIMNVPGIKQAAFSKIEDLITVN